MVSINVSKDKFDRIVNRETQEGKVLWNGRPDIFKINFKATSSLPFSVDLYTNGVKLKSFHNEHADSILEETIQISVKPRFGQNYIDIVFSCDEIDDKISAQQKSIEFDSVSINDQIIEQSNFGMDSVCFQSSDLSYLLPDKQETYRYELLRRHGGYFGFFGRIRFPYYRFVNADDSRIYKRNDYGVDCNNNFTVIYDDPPRKTKDLFKNV